MHCRSTKNDCQGPDDCFCECEACWDADDADFEWDTREYERSDAPDVDAAGNCYSDADPGL